MAKRSPISRNAANEFLSDCLGDPNSLRWSYGDMSYCCVEDPVTLETTCVGCKNDESQCYLYEEFREVSNVINYARISSDVSLAPPDVEPTEPYVGDGNDLVGELVAGPSKVRGDGGGRKDNKGY